MLKSGDSVAVGVSGGADSVCLLFLLNEIKKEISLDLKVIHVHHGIRETADRDAEYVEKLAGNLGLDITIVREDVPALAKHRGLTEEEAGRKVRYEAFEKAGTDRIAVAHNMSDNAETMLFNLIRGTGIKGISGIAPVRGKVIRPLLEVSRDEIEEYLKDNGIAWMEDETNSVDEYTRNIIRHRIIPEALAISPGSIERMSDTAKRLRRIDDFVTAYAKEVSSRIVKTNEAGSLYIIKADDLTKEHIAVREAILYDILFTLSPHARDITSKHIDIVMQLAERDGNRKVSLPFGITAARSYDDITIGTCDAPDSIENEYTVFIKCDKIVENALRIRTRKEGDSIRLSDGKGGFFSKSVKAYMIDSKIPASLRDDIPLAVMDDEVIWIAGERLSDAYKPDGTGCEARLHIVNTGGNWEMEMDYD